MLKRMYRDRISEGFVGINGPGDLICPDCGKLLGVSIIYKKEDRSAYRLFVGVVGKKIIKSKKIILRKVD